LAITYAIPDIHGRLDLLVRAMELIAEDVAARGRPPFKTVFLGDFIDRGPASAQVIALVRTMQREAGKRVVALRGNHEEIVVQTVTSRRVEGGVVIGDLPEWHPTFRQGRLESHRHLGRPSG